MRFHRLTAAALLVLAGCSAQPEFVQVRPGVAVSSRLISEYMEEHNASREEAKAALADEVMTSPGTAQ